MIILPCFFHDYIVLILMVLLLVYTESLFIGKKITKKKRSTADTRYMNQNVDYREIHWMNKGSSRRTQTHTN